MDKRASGVKAQSPLSLRAQTPLGLKAQIPLGLLEKAGGRLEVPGDVDNSIIYEIKNKKFDFTIISMMLSSEIQTYAIHSEQNQSSSQDQSHYPFLGKIEEFSQENQGFEGIDGSGGDAFGVGFDGIGEGSGDHLGVRRPAGFGSDDGYGGFFQFCALDGHWEWDGDPFYGQQFYEHRRNHG